jgi:formylglycine-generating enzyme required for sulfatase activity
MGFALTQAQRWLAKRKDDIGKADQDFIARSASAARRSRRRLQALVSVPVAAVAAAALIAVAAWKQDWLKEESYALLNATPLTAARDSSIKSGESFKECRDCPDMIVVPAGQFMMGSPDGRGTREHPKHQVTIARPFAVAKFELTFDEWDACRAHGVCPLIFDSGFGRGQKPVINVSWDEAKKYVAWLSRITGKTYRLLSEAEYEYAARAGTETRFPWGDDVKLNGKAMANCSGCGSQWDGKTAMVGSFDPNGFGLYDMVGNVLSWTEDCWNKSYDGAPDDGSPWTRSDCTGRPARGGSWMSDWRHMRSAARDWRFASAHASNLGFRVARTLSAEGGAIGVPPGVR